MFSKQNVLIIDDHEAVRVGVSSLLSKQENINLIGTYSDGESAYESLATNHADVVITDLSMPGIGGIETISRITARNKEIKVIVFTMHHQVVHMRYSLKAGASGFILKSDNISFLLEAIKYGTTKKPYLSPAVAQALALETFTANSSAIDGLSSREYEVFCYLVKGMKVREIANLLSISTKTVSTYQTQLKQKLQINTPVEMVKIAIDAGIEV